MDPCERDTLRRRHSNLSFTSFRLAFHPTSCYFALLPTTPYPLLPREATEFQTFWHTLDPRCHRGSPNCPKRFPIVAVGFLEAPWVPWCHLDVSEPRGFIHVCVKARVGIAEWHGKAFKSLYKLRPRATGPVPRCSNLPTRASAFQFVSERPCQPVSVWASDEFIHTRFSRAAFFSRLGLSERRVQPLSV